MCLPLLLCGRFETTCRTDECPFAAVESTEGGRQLFGFQFHPEVTHSKHGETILGNFIEVAGLKGSWRMDNFIESQVLLRRRITISAAATHLSDICWQSGRTRQPLAFWGLTVLTRIGKVGA